jgi:hypothetical protein
MNLSGFQWICGEFTWIYLVCSGFAVSSHGFIWFSVDLRLVHMDLSGFQWIYGEFTWIYLVFSGFALSSHGFTWFSVDLR